MITRPPDHDALFSPERPSVDDARLITAEQVYRAGDDAFRIGDFQRAGLLFRRALDAPLPASGHEAAYTHALPLERLTELALAEGDPVFADIYALRSVRADPTDGSARVTQLRAAFAVGRGDEGELERLLVDHPALPSTQSFAGAVAWARGDLNGARLAWTRGAAISVPTNERELDHQNHCLACLYLDAAAATTLEADDLPFGRRDVTSLAAAVVVALRYGQPIQETRVTSNVLVPALVPWLEHWIATGAEEALLAFQRGAIAQRERLPGVETLLNFG